MERFLLICLEGSIGTGARCLTAIVAARWFGAEFPYGTLIVNLAPLLIVVRPEDSLTQAIQLMMQHQVKRLIVVDAEGRFRGLVDRREVLRTLAGDAR